MSIETWSLTGMLIGALMMSGSLLVLGLSWAIQKIEEYWGPM